MAGPGTELRTGIGCDTHRLQAGRPLFLGGVRVPHVKGLLGHSDADVVCHALSDALLGAVALGDIGTHFPADDPKYKDANSIDLLKQVWSKIRAAGWQLANADITITAEAPRLGPHIGAMRGAVALALEVPIGRISIKATTTEGLGPEGEGRAISAVAICLIVRDDA